MFTTNTVPCNLEQAALTYKSHITQRENRPMIFLGIDPGIKGGLAVINAQGRLLLHTRMPIVKRGKATHVYTSALRRWIEELEAPHRVSTVMIEAVHSMPSQGVASSFTFGRVTGAVEGWAMSLCPDVRWVTPSVWKKHFGLSSDKQASLDWAKLRYGDDHQLWDVKANDGIAEALLLALYARDAGGAK